LPSGAVAVYDIAPGVTRIGRASSNDIVLGDPLVSLEHAELRTVPNVPPELRDLGGASGTLVNGQAIDRCVLAPDDAIAIGPCILRYDGTRFLKLPASEGIAFGAAHLSVVLRGGRELLNDVSFSLDPHTLMAVVGPSGSGKSTLLNVLAGSRSPTTGKVFCAGQDLYTQYPALRRRIGFVPQQSILHDLLTLKEEIGYAAKLRFPADKTVGEHAQRLREVVAKLDLTDRLDSRMDRFSGGERKRANIALELLTEPSLLILDEPASGLDLNIDYYLMHKLRALADDGPTVVVATHHLEHLASCDLVMVLARGGYVAFLGPPGDVLEYFGAATWAGVFDSLRFHSPSELAAYYRGWTGRDTRAMPAFRDGAMSPGVNVALSQPKSIISQVAALCQRQLAVTHVNHALLAFLTLLPTVLAILARLITDAGLAHHAGNSGAPQLLVVLVVGASVMGAAGSINELVKERGIYQRERAVGLSSAAYLASKVIVLAAIGVVQGALLTVLALWGRPPAQEALLFGIPTLELAIVVAAVAAVSALLGLVISAAASSETQAMALFLLVGLAQLMMSGGVIPIAGRPVLDQLSWLLPSRWGLAAAAATVDVPFLRGARSGSDPLWEHSARIWLFDVGMLTLIGVASTAATGLLLRKRNRSR
jgi:ABC-type multidrug transport system ATPase subunit